MDTPNLARQVLSPAKSSSDQQEKSNGTPKKRYLEKYQQEKEAEADNINDITFIGTESQDECQSNDLPDNR